MGYLFCVKKVEGHTSTEHPVRCNGMAVILFDFLGGSILGLADGQEDKRDAFKPLMDTR